MSGPRSTGGPRRLLFISNLFPDTHENYRGQDNAEVLRRLVARGWQVRAVAPRPVLWPRLAGHRWANRTARPDEAAMQPCYPLYRYLPKIGGLANHLLLRHALRRVLPKIAESFSPEVALCSWAFPDTVAAAPLLRAAGVPFCGLVQGTDVHGYLASPRRRRLIVEALGGAHGVICRSGDLGRRLAGAGVARDRLHTIYNGVDTGLFRPGDQAAARAAVGMEGPGPWLLYIGNFYPVKNPELAVAALARLRMQPEFSNARLALIGGGPQIETVREAAGRLGIAEALHFIGRLPSAQVAEYLRAADVLVIPSRNEGLPNVLLESLASGCPVVSTRVGGIAEVLKEPHFGRLVPSGDAAAMTAALAGLLADPPARRTIAAHGATFTWDRCVDQVEALLHGCAAG